MTGYGANRGKVLEKMVHLFGQMPDKEDLKDGGSDEVAEDRHPMGDPAPDGAEALDRKLGNPAEAFGNGQMGAQIQATGPKHTMPNFPSAKALGTSPIGSAGQNGMLGGGQKPLQTVGNFSSSHAAPHIDPKGQSFFDPLGNRKGNRR